MIQEPRNVRGYKCPGISETCPDNFMKFNACLNVNLSFICSSQNTDIREQESMNQSQAKNTKRFLV